MIKRLIRVEELNEDERCAKHLAALTDKLAKEKSDEASNFEEIPEKEVDREKKEELPFEDILSEQRRKYTTKREFVYRIYNDLMGTFVKEREGTVLRKTATHKNVSDEHPEEDEKESTNEVSERADAAINKEETSILDWKLFLPDENVGITFVNDNSYNGRISRQKMEGPGLYNWRSGSRYKGEFEDNKIQRRGMLEWQDNGWYEGDFLDGYRHGKGTMVDRNYNLLYIGHWHRGHKHGKGYCRYEKGDSYDGDWVMDKREGVGNRIYQSGARYVGHWKNGLRHGIGTMTWPNGDVYRGEWKDGAPHGYGEYTWTGFFNKTLCWPQEISYMGGWLEGTRNGKGQLSLNSIGGARYSGEWKNNKKHGYGTIIGNNGDIIEGDPLFEDNTLLPVSTTKKLPDAPDTQNAIDNKDSHGFPEKPDKIPEARATTVLNPEQCFPLRYYIDRLRETKTTSSSSSLVSLISGKCRTCEDNSSCRCLRHCDDKESPDKASRSMSGASRTNSIFTAASSILDRDRKNSDFTTMKLKSGNLEQEEYWTHNCITMHMPRIREVYDVYSKIFCNDSPNCRLSMSKLSLWQLWRDCGVHKKGFSVVQIDNFIAANKFTLTEDPHCPFGRIEIWQLLHAFLEVSWHIYTKNGNIDADGFPGRLANGLDKFLLRDIYPNFGKSVGILVGPERDLLPLYPVYQLYLSIGKLHSARQLLKNIFTEQKSIGNSESKRINHSNADYLRTGKNAVTVGEKLSYLSSGDKPLFHPRPDLENLKRENWSANESTQISADSLSVLRELGMRDFVHIMSTVCPAIKDPETDLIVDMQYQITFLEFFEIFVEAGKKLVLKRKLKREADEAKAESVKTASIIGSSKERKTSRSIVRLSSSSKSTKSRKKLVTKH